MAFGSRLLFLSLQAMSEKNPKLDFEIRGYLNPFKFKILIAFAATNSLTRSGLVNNLAEQFIQANFSKKQQERFLEFYEKLTPEQRKNPNKYWDLSLNKQPD